MAGESLRVNSEPLPNMINCATSPKQQPPRVNLGHNFITKRCTLSVLAEIVFYKDMNFENVFFQFRMRLLWLLGVSIALLQVEKVHNCDAFGH